MNTAEYRELKIFSINMRILTLRMIETRGFGHLGGSSSIIEVLAVLFEKTMRLNPQAIHDPQRDYFILSKGHAGPAYYAALAMRGYLDEAELMTLNQNKTRLPSHPDRNKTPGVDCTTGSLGQGISQAAGVAYALKLLKRPNRVFCIIGDGECNEGQVWEALQFIVHKKLSNLIILVDNNHQQVDGFTADVSFDFHFPALFKSLGFVTAEADGSDLRDIDKAINKMLKIENQAKMIILNTKKAQLLPYYENKAASHHLKLTDTDRGYFAKYINELIQQREMLKHDVQADQY